MTPLRQATAVATGLAILCPACGEPQPDPEMGSDIWTPEQYRQCSESPVPRTCVSCDKPYRIFLHPKIQVAR